MDRDERCRAHARRIREVYPDLAIETVRPIEAGQYNDVLLVDGRAVLNDSGELMRVEGKLAKNPSFWTSLVNIVRRYARVGGVRVPVATETTAKVKFVGTAQMDVLYDYQSVNGRPIAVSGMSPSAPAHIAER